jgi:hypothetical protein
LNSGAALPVNHYSDNNTCRQQSAHKHHHKSAMPPLLSLLFFRGEVCKHRRFLVICLSRSIPNVC